MVNIAIFAESGMVSPNHDITLLLNGANFTPNSGIQLSVQWGDGTSNTYGMTFPSAGSLGVPSVPIQHYYPNVNQTYIAIVTIFTSLGQINYTVLVNLQSACGTAIQTVVTWNCPNFNTSILSSIPVIFTNNMNQNFTVNVAHGQTIFTSTMPAGTYIYNIDPAWLNANGLISTLNNQTVSYNGTSVMNIQFALECTNNVQNCITGYVFCDANGNNQFDPNEQVFPNTQIIIAYGGTSSTVITDANGYYSFIVPNNASAPFTITMASSFFQQNPNITNPYPNGQYLTSLIPCGSGSTNNFALQDCGNPPTPMGCVSGYVFCDNNNNGFYNSNSDLGLAGAPVNISLNNGTTITVYTDQNGYFSYIDSTSLGNLIAVVSLNPNWIASNGYSFPQNPITAYFNCASTQPIFFPTNCGTVDPCANLWSTVQPWIGYYQNQNNQIKIQWGNNGPQAPGIYTLTLVYPADVTPVVSSIMNPNYIISGNSIIWTINSSSTYFSFTDIISFFVPMGIEPLPILRTTFFIS